MSVGGVPANDAGLLRVAASLRNAADSIAGVIADHNGQHDDHATSECQSAQLKIGQMLMEVAMAMSGSAANLVSSAMNLAGIETLTDEGDDNDWEDDE